MMTTLRIGLLAGMLAVLAGCTSTLVTECSPLPDGGYRCTQSGGTVRN